MIAASAFAQAQAPAASFDIPAGELADALDRFGEQSGLQVVYEHALLHGKRVLPLTGKMQPSEALDRLLSGSGLSWSIIDGNTVVVERSPAREASAGESAEEVARRRKAVRAIAEDVAALEKYETFGSGDDPVGLLPVEPVDSVFGFGKTVLETPRSLSVLNDDMMAVYGVESALDVAKIVPSTYTASVFSINGNVNIRGVASDTYFRGVKRLENTQLFPAPITAMSRVDIVRGPPSPVYGPGKIGGYTNFVPKSARASTGKLLDEIIGKAVVTIGSFDKKSAAAEVGGPFSVGGKRGGYYVYGNIEDSDTYYDNVPFEQHILQSSFDVELTGRVRAEAGQMFQRWRGTELAGWNRITQELIDTGLYNAGTMQLDMDLNGDGLISTAEVDQFGPLLREFAPGTPAETVGAALGPGWVVDPSTVSKVKLRRSANAQSSEDYGEAKVHLAYFDLIFDLDESAKLTSKSYFERMRRFKWTRASAFGQDTDSSVFEQKLMYEKRFDRLDGDFSVNTSASVLYREYDTRHLTGTKYSDLVNRPDISRPFDPRNRFAVPNLEPHLAPWNTGLFSNYSTIGAGALFDVTYRRTNVVLGVRYDWVDIFSRIPDFVLTTPGQEARGNDKGLSWSVSLSQEVVTGIRPYATYARQETLVHGVDGGIGVTVVPDALNTAELREVGVKASLFDDRLFAAVSAYRQTRVSFSAETLQVPSTLSTGWELEARWVPNRRFSLAGGGTWQRITYTPLRPATTMVNPSFFGLPDGYYGGRLQASLTGEPQYAERSGYPDVVLNLNGTYFLTDALALHLTTVYQSEAPSGRIRDIILPEALIVGAAIVYDAPQWSARLAVNNLTNELYFTPNSPDYTGELIVIPAPERHFQLSLTYKF